jgi:RNA polymerase sigma factor (sigma-70 family)
MGKLLEMPDPPLPHDPAAVARERRDDYVLAHLGLVQAIARRVKRTHRHLDIEDLRGAGYVGLIEAAGRYTRASHATFATFAYRRIQGEMLELARRRQLRENSGDPLPVIGIPDPAAGGAVESIDTRHRVRAILSRLTERERGILIAYYLQGHTLRAVGEDLGVSKGQAGRIVRSIVQRARRIEKEAA